MSDRATPGNLPAPEPPATNPPDVPDLGTPETERDQPQPPGESDVLLHAEEKILAPAPLEHQEPTVPNNPVPRPPDNEPGPEPGRPGGPPDENPGKRNEHHERVKRTSLEDASPSPGKIRLLDPTRPFGEAMTA